MRRPRRPGLPFLLLPAVAFWMGICIGEDLVWRRFQAGMEVGDGFSLMPAALLLPGILGIVLLARCGKRAVGAPPSLIACAVACCIGLCAGCICWNSLHASMEMAGDVSGPVALRITGDPVEGSFGSYSLASMQVEGASPRVRVMWGESEDAPPVGAEVRCTGTFTALGDGEKMRGQHRSLIVGRFTPSDIEEVSWAPTLQGFFGGIRQSCIEQLAAIDGDGAAILRGILLGDRSAVSDTTIGDAFRATGLAHMLAVSGTHLTIVSLLVTWALQKMGASRRLTILVVGVTVIVFLVFTALQPSAFRACIMALVASASWFAGRRGSSIAALSLATVGLLALDPSNAFSVGFQLSVLGAAGLCIFLPLGAWWVERLLPDRWEVVGQPLALTLVAQAATAPVALPTFSMLSLIGPLANLIVSPAIAVLLGGGLVSLLLWISIPMVGEVLLVAMSRLADMLAHAINVLFNFPIVAVPVDVPLSFALVSGVVAAIVLWVRWPLPSRRAIRRIAVGATTVAGLVALLFPVAGGANLVVMDVGQGDAILLSDGRHQVLVDTGPSDSALRAALGRQGVRHLDALVLTHFDDDHVGALGALRSLVGVDRVLVAAGSIEAAEADGKALAVMEEAAALCGEENVIELIAGDVIRVSDRMVLAVVWPCDRSGDSSNARSVCLVLEFDADGRGGPEHAVLLAGDAESPELEEMVVAGLDEIDVMKVGHHGSAAALSAQALRTLSPRIALISVGTENRYGHPSEKTIGLLEEAGARVYRTDEDGDISLVLDAGGLSIRCGR